MEQARGQLLGRVTRIAEGEVLEAEGDPEQRANLPTEPGGFVANSIVLASFGIPRAWSREVTANVIYKRAKLLWLRRSGGARGGGWSSRIEDPLCDTRDAPPFWYKSMYHVGNKVKSRDPAPGCFAGSGIIKFFFSKENT